MKPIKKDTNRIAKVNSLIEHELGPVLHEFLDWQTKEKQRIEDEKKGITADRQNVDKYYNEVRGMEVGLKEEREDLRQKAVTLSGRSMIRTIKKITNGSL